MTLMYKAALKIGGLALALVLLGAATLWGLTETRGRLRAANDEYLELRIVQQVSVRANAAKGLLQGRNLIGDTIPQLDGAIQAIDSFIAFQDGQTGVERNHQQRELTAATRARTDLHSLRQVLDSRPDVDLVSSRSELIAGLEGALNTLNALAAQMDVNIGTDQKTSAARLRTTLILNALLSAAALLLITLIGLSHYRGVLAPLHRLRTEVRRIASGDFKGYIRLAGTGEFSDLAADINHIARNLQSLSTDLECKVLVRSRELVRSERLASVGFLAAGVAHEINNPLNIITGYAELSLRQADRLPEPQAAADIKEAFHIIREEAFRCKTITDKLLSLARASAKSRQSVSIARVAQDAVALIQSLTQFCDRRVRLALSPGDPFTVWGNENELKQVVLNLVVNALQNVPPRIGQVVIHAVRQNREIEFSVIDNGRGMTPEVLEHIFEPFFSERRPEGGRGLGLGLSITRAIVEAHGGCITAESTGPGQGGCFTISLPAKDDTPMGEEKAAARPEFITA